MAKRGRPKGSTSKGMAEKKRRAINLMELNPTRSIQQIADYAGVSYSTAAKWYNEADFRKYYECPANV